VISGDERPRVLVAGIGNVFLGDDGFGVEVVNRIDGGTLPAAVDVVDYGIRGIHLAYELLDGSYDTLILIDAVPLDGPPGTLAVLDVPDNQGDGEGSGGGEGDEPFGGAAALDGHGLHPEAVLRMLRRLGGTVPRVLVVGCRPGVLDESLGLSAPVRAAVAEAVRLTTDLARAEADPERRAAEGTDA
jgi:hydrogenase maturation protease